MKIINHIDIIKNLPEYKSIKVLLRHSHNSTEKDFHARAYKTVCFGIKILEGLRKE